MMKRQKSMILFACIAMLLTAKAGISLWGSVQMPSSQPAERGLTSVQRSSEHLDMEQSLQLLAVTTQPPQTKVSEPYNASDATDNLNHSWAMLEAYLIPEAGAASAPAADNNTGLTDETLTSLRDYRQQLDQRSNELDQRSKSLQQAEASLKQRITELEQLEASIQQRLSDEAKIKNKKIKRLTAVYEGMKPERSAPVIAKMDLATVVKIFLLMDEKKVGKILSFLPPDKAVRISQALTRQISSVR